jgi:choline-sulfatase
MPTDSLTWPYLLRQQGYDTALSGKMHLIGQDQLHGFEKQLAYDPHVREPLPHFLWSNGIPEETKPWHGVRQAAAGVSPMIEADEAIESAAIEYLEDPARKEKPFALCIGLIAPHFPFIVPEPWFSMYWPDNTDSPALPDGHLDNLPPAASRLKRMFGYFGWSEEDIRKARAAYYGLISYLDDKLGRLMDVLEAQGLSENTVVVHTSDHGDMLGEHGLWRKMSMYEQSSRVPLQISFPGRFQAGLRVRQAVSTVDAVATMLQVAGVDTDRFDLDGQSLLTALETGDTSNLRDEAISEHFAHGTDRAVGMIRRGKWKLCYGHGDASEIELYDLEADPGEFENLAGRADAAQVQRELTDRLMEIWGDPDDLTRRILLDQEERGVIRGVTGVGTVF